MSRILIIEDDPAIRRGLMDSLQAERYDVLAAADGEVGLRLSQEGSPDLIIRHCETVMTRHVANFNLPAIRKRKIKSLGLIPC